MRPLVDQSLSEVGAVTYFNQLMGRYQAIPFAPKVDADLTGHVVNKGMDGIFFYLAREEKAIRENPVKRTTALLRRVSRRRLHNSPLMPKTDLIETRIPPSIRDIGGFTVSRLLPSHQQRAIGPFVFFDQMGPTQFAPGQGIDVRPHPHIGLATLTFLYEGEIEHRDSLGTNQVIRPDEVNWMVAGYGITHSERTSAKTRGKRASLSGIQTWIALPDEHEETEPRFEHFGADALPVTKTDSTQLRLIIGGAFGMQAPAHTYSEMFFVDALLVADAPLLLTDEHQDRGIFVAQGSIQVSGEVYNQGELLVAKPHSNVEILSGPEGARLALFGGEPIASPRRLWWNFVASSKEKIDAAKASWLEADWSNGRFQLPPDDNDEFIPLPDR